MASSSVTLGRALAQSLVAAAASGGAHASSATLAVAPVAAAAVPMRGVRSCSFSPSSSSSFFGGPSSSALTRVPCRQAIGIPVHNNGGSGRGVHVVASANGTGASTGLAIDLRGKTAFIAGVADDQGFGWGIAKALAAAGATILVGTWVPALNIFETSLRRGKFDESRKLPNGSMFEIAKVYPLDAVFDTLEDVPEDIKKNKRYAGSSRWTVKEVVETVEADYGKIDILVHSLANGPEVTKALLDTSRKGYLAAISASSYSYISLLKYFAPIMNPGGSAISLTYLAGERAIPGYGGGMSSAKAALDSDTKVLAFEAGRKYNIRVNSISAGPLRSRAAKAIGFIDNMINYSTANAPLQKELESDDVGAVAAFLSSSLASAVTGAVVYVDNGLHCMGVAPDSPTISKAAEGSPVAISSVPA